MSPGGFSLTARQFILEPVKNGPDELSHLAAQAFPSGDFWPQTQKPSRISANKRISHAFDHIIPQFIKYE